MKWIFNRIWYCNNLGWHKTPKEIKKGVLFGQYGICPICGKEIYRGWDGSWSSK